MRIGCMSCVEGEVDSRVPTSRLKALRHDLHHALKPGPCSRLPIRTVDAKNQVVTIDDDVIDLPVRKELLLKLIEALSFACVPCKGSLLLGTLCVLSCDALKFGALLESGAELDDLRYG